MIKLNNKNITYVALADSNNSLKAPKEIWYADSPNSVKLVYRRKDALIEGEDYEVHQWLKAVCPINKTMMTLPIGSQFFNWKVKVEQIGNIIYFRSDNYAYYTDNTNIVNIWDIPNAVSIFSAQTVRTDGMTVDISSTSESLIFNGEIIPKYEFPNILFQIRNSDSGVRDAITYISSITIDGIERYIPVKLLKPVPKWLDANGIRRQVGECGMIDLVSGKFYGNVNSSGTFTVENYYERKEWLQGRNGAYIDTNYYPIVGTDIFSVHFHYDGTTRNPDGGEQDAFGVNYKDSNGSNFIRAYIQKSNKLACSYYKHTDTYPTTNIQSNEWNIDNLLINGSKFQYTANGTSYSFDNNDIQQQICQFPLFIFKNNEQVWGYDNYYLHGDISSFKITDSSSTKMNLIPCTLTMDLPASMDANNIARTKGTSGMWDLVSDKFYGNVANSGTFKAVNLAEGVDYEVHQWLKTTLNSRGTYMTLPINSDNLSFKRIISSVANSSWMVTNGFSYFSYSTTGDKPLAISCWDSNQSESVFWLYKKFDEEIEVVSTSNSLTFGGTSAGQYGYPIQNVRFSNGINGTSEFKTSSIYVDGVERYIPVKLLKSIPAKYDANGIARNTGECGMYDTVNDLFYGNVASSGTFSVSD